ncbi:MAG TPA: hypothetical protein VGI76_08190 [Solirubrobacteraceae bacterium]|jgi:hypothetical protein
MAEYEREDMWQGQWLMADGQRLQGELSFTEGAGAILRVFGSRPTSLSEPVRWAQALHGTTLGGQDLTLLDVALYRSQDHLSGSDETPTSQEWRSQTLILGVHVATEEDLQFSTATFRISGIEEWLTEPWHGPAFSPPPTLGACDVHACVVAALPRLGGGGRTGIGTWST